MKLFLSHVSEDLARVEQAQKAIEDYGEHTAWHYTGKMGAGRWAEQVQGRLNDADAVIVFLSASVKPKQEDDTSSWVVREVRYAHDRGTPIVPVLLDDVEPTTITPHLSEGVQLQALQSITWHGEAPFPVEDLFTILRNTPNLSWEQTVRRRVPPVRPFASAPFRTASLDEWSAKGGDFDHSVGLLRRNPAHLTFIVGPGAVQLKQGESAEPSLSPDAEPSLDDISWDKWVLGRAQSLGALEEASPVESFVEKLKGDRAEGRQIVEVESEDAELTRLRATLLRLAYTATTAFLESCAKESMPMTTWAQHTMRAERNTPTDKAVEEAVGSVAELTHITYPLLGATSMQLRLDALRNQLRLRGLVAGSTVEWLTDLFWHSMTFDSKMYPRVDELAIQVSLMQESMASPIRHLPPVESVHRGEDPKGLAVAAAASVCRGYVPGERSERRTFYDAVAATLYDEHWRWRRRSKGEHVASFALALTTNLDLELERALSACSTDRASGFFHVATPVLLARTDPKGETQFDVRWLIGEFARQDSEDLDALASPTGPWRWLQAAASGHIPSLSGPLVVKLAGSPLHDVPRNPLQASDKYDLPDIGVTPGGREGQGKPKGSFRDRKLERDAADAASSNRVTIDHALSLGEVDFMQLTRLTSWSFDTYRPDGQVDSRVEGLPSWLCDALVQESRFWLLTGCRMSDWNRRTEIYTLLSQRPRGEGASVAYSQDDDRTRFLAYLGVRRIQGNCHGLVQALDRLRDYWTRESAR